MTKSGNHSGRATRLLAMLAGLGVIAPALASATIHSGTINGDEAQATTCAVGSTSRIVGTVTYDDVSGLFSWSYTYGDNAPAYDNGALFAGGTPTVAHFHGPAAPGVPAAVRVTSSALTPAADSTLISAAFGAELLDELWYLNIHSSNCGGGELRGQVLFASGVPSSSTWMLMALLGLMLAASVVALRRPREA